MKTITLRQAEVLAHVNECGVIGSGYDGSVLRSLRAKGLVFQHYNQAPCGTYYTWTLSPAGRELLSNEVRISR